VVLPVEELIKPRADERLEIVPEIHRVLSAHMGVDSCNAVPTSFSTRMLLYRRPHFGCGGETAIASSELSVVKLLTALACTRSGRAQRYELLDVKYPGRSYRQPAR
jgi:hypothetical protein